MIKTHVIDLTKSGWQTLFAVGRFILGAAALFAGLALIFFYAIAFGG